MGGRDGDLGYLKALWKSGKFVLPILHTLLMLALLRECSCFFSLFQDIMPSGLTVHRVLIAPRDSILQNVETVIQCSTWPLHHWRSPAGFRPTGSSFHERFPAWNNYVSIMLRTVTLCFSGQSFLPRSLTRDDGTV
ncbi:hypothetical protein TNCV_4757571 [Trichonephila clavipes]|nr:hypothetical protein TNCV_4757571 [Trichonephila clavipes]